MKNVINRRRDVNTGLKCCMIFLYALAGTLSLSGIVAVSGDFIWYTNSFLSCCIFAVNVYLVKRIYPSFKKTTKRNKTYAVLFAFILSMALHFGARLEADGYVMFTNIWLWISVFLFGCYLSLFIHFGWERLPAVICKVTNHMKSKGDETEKAIEKSTHIGDLFQKIINTSWMTWLALLFLWLPTFLAFFPGAFVYDAQDEYVQVAAREFTTHHPLLHELLLGVPIRAAEHFGMHANVGIAVYTIFQMIVLSGIFTYLFMLLKRWNINFKYRGVLLLIIGLFPVYPMYAVCSAKDTLFSGVMLLVILILLDFVKNDRDKLDFKSTILFIAASVGMLLLRNNGIYAYILLIPVLLIMNFKRFKKIALIMLISFILFICCSNALKFSLKATDDEHQEMLTVPIQQLARTYEYAPDVFSEEDKQTLYEILSKEALDTYTPKISDIIKSQFNNEAYALNKGKFLSLWVRTGTKKPFVYLNAWMLTSYGYWYPDAILNSYGGIQRFTFQYENSSYFGFETEPPGERHSLFPLLEEFYRNISLELFQQKIPVLSMTFSPGFLFWVFAFIWIRHLREKKKEIFGVLSIIFLLWLTVLLGPTTLVRYMLILWFVLPVQLLGNSN